MSIEKKKIITYIDGFNLYFGIREKFGRKLIWLNLAALSECLLKPHQYLTSVKYFTSRIVAPPDKVKRQTTFIEALETLPNLEIIYGNYQIDVRTCLKCGFVDQIPHEKKTDVNIAVELITDAIENKYDEAILISADADLVPALVKIKTLCPEKKIIIAFPPGRFSKNMSEIGFPYFKIGRRKLEISQFPEEVVKDNGYILTKPKEWK